MDIAVGVVAHQQAVVLVVDEWNPLPTHAVDRLLQRVAGPAGGLFIALQFRFQADAGC